MTGLVGIVGSGLVLGGVSPAMADDKESSNNRVSQSIWAASNKDGDLSGKKAFDLNEMTPEELQFFGVFLSNYYIPYVTEFDKESSDSLKSAKESMVSVLKEQMQFSEVDAKALVEYVVAQTQQSSTKLEWGFSRSATPGSSGEVEKEYDSEGNELPKVAREGVVAKGSSAIPANLRTLHAFSAGGAFQGSTYTSKKVTGDWVDHDVCVSRGGDDRIKCWADIYAIDRYKKLGGEKASDEEYKKWGITKERAASAVANWDGSIDRDYKKGEPEAYGIKAFREVAAGNRFGILLANGKPVFSVDLTGDTVTPSMVAYAAGLGMVDPEKGYGTEFFDASGKEDFKDTLGSTVYGMDLYVDPFGNIIAAGENHNYVVISAAMNPYTWKGLTNDGNEILKASQGGIYNPMTLQQMSLSATYPDFLGGTTNAVKDQNKVHIPDVKGQAWWVDVDSAANKLPAPQMAGNNKTAFQTCDVNIGVIRDRNKLWAYSNDAYNIFGGKVRDNSEHQGQLGNAIARYNRGNSDYTFKAGSNWFGHSENEGGAAVLKVLSEYADKKTYDSKAIKQYAKDGAMTKYLNTGGGYNGLNTYYLGAISKKASDGEVYRFEYAYGEGVNCVTKGIVVDPLEVYEGLDGGKEANSLFNVIDVLDSNGKFIAGEQFKTSDSFIKGTPEYGDVAEPSVANSDTVYNLYFNYLASAYGLLGGTEADKAKAASLGYAMDVSNYPAPNSGISIEIDEEALEDEMLKDIRNWTWYLLNPTEGFNYVTTLITNKSTHFLMNNHAGMVGTTNASGVAGSTNYTGFSGYVTLPELTDLEWTDKLMDGYNKNYPYIVLGMIVLLGIYAVLGILTLGQMIASMVIFGIMALLPANLVNTAVTVTNNASNAMYGKKFMYWALLQNQTYSAAIDEAASSNSYTNYLEIQMQQNAKIDITGAGLGANSKGNDSVVVKWQSPKKLASIMINADDAEDMAFAGLCSTDDKGESADKADDKGEEKKDDKAEDKKSDASGDAECKNGKYTAEDRSALYDMAFTQLENGKSGQSFIDDPNSTFLYRSYIDLNNYSRYIYKGLSNGTAEYNEQPDTTNWPEDLRKSYERMVASQTEDGDSGYTNSEEKGGKNLRITAPMSSKIVGDSFADGKKLEGLTQESKVGIDTRRFNFSLPAFTKGTDIIPSLEANAQAREMSVEGFDPTKDGYTEKDYAGLAAYSLMSESPFFYYSWNLYDEGVSTENGATEGYKQLILKGDGTEYFYNTAGNGEIKDYLNMKDMFTYTIPYLHAGNKVVRDFDKIYGLKYEKGVPIQEGLENDPDITGDPVLKQKYWKNVQISRLYGMYSPWVDQMYSTDYAEQETLSFQDGTVTITNPLDPASYPEDRPMIFSKSEQVDFGLRDEQLTKVERKILKVNEQVQERMFQLLNAYNFNDNVLNTASAMEATFAFNQAFSESSLLGTSINLYPQSYELKNFSYDAYLRLILSESTGESITGDTANGFYDRIVQNSSMMTAFVLLAVDVTSVYLIPAFKLFLIISLGIVSVLMLIAAVIRAQEGIWKNIFKSLFKPLLLMMALFIGMAAVVSAFMSNGNTSVTGDSSTQISLGDPVMVLLVMLAINIIVLVLSGIIIWGLLKDMKSYSTAIYGSFKSAGQGAASMAKNVAKGQSFQDARNGTGTVVAGAVAGGVVAGAVAEGASRGNESARDRADRNRGRINMEEKAGDVAAETAKAGVQGVKDTANIAGGVVKDTANNVAATAQRVDKAGRAATRGVANALGAIPVAGGIIKGVVGGAVDTADAVAPVGGRKGVRDYTASGLKDAVGDAAEHAKESASNIRDAAEGHGRSRGDRPVMGTVEVDDSPKTKPVSRNKPRGTANVSGSLGGDDPQPRQRPTMDGSGGRSATTPDSEDGAGGESGRGSRPKF